MRTRFLAVAVAALALVACDNSESYELGASETFARVLGSASTPTIASMPTGLQAMSVTSSFSSIPTDRTAYWTFNRKGQEIARINVLVTGDEETSKVSYSYAEGPGAAANEKLARLIKQHMSVLVTEAVDSAVDKRAADGTLRGTADAMTIAASTSLLLDEGNAELAKIPDGMLSGAGVAAPQAPPSQAAATAPATDLSQY